MTDQVIATEDAIVHDDVLGIDRKVFAGQPVPPDLVEAYQGGARAGDGSDPVDYDAESVEELEKLVADRKLEVKGTGADGNVVKADLVKALQAPTPRPERANVLDARRRRGRACADRHRARPEGRAGGPRSARTHRRCAGHP
jgi:hypothetical protein